MPRIPVPFWTQHYEAGSKQVTAERLVNWYLEPSPQSGKFPYALYPTPGLTLFATCGDGPVRGIHRMSHGDVFVVSGGYGYWVSADKTVTQLGQVPGSGNVGMVDDGRQVLVTTGTDSVVLDKTGVYSIPEPGLLASAYQDGYAIAVKQGSEQFYISGLDDLGSWSALDFSSADAKADNLVSVVSLQRLLVLLGSTTIEWWYNSGDPSFPFTRAQGGYANIGCAAPLSAVVEKNTVFWLGDDLNFYVAAGFEPQSISTPGMVRYVEARSEYNDCKAFAYAQAGHTFYVATFNDGTAVYDITTGLWHTRESLDEDRWRVSDHTLAWNKHLAGDHDNGNVYEIDDEVYDENGTTIIRSADSPPLHAAGNRAVMHELYVDMEPGVGLTSGQGSDPKLMMKWSDDLGHTWSSERQVPMGKKGEYNNRARAFRLGSFRQRTIRISVSDPVKAVVTGAYAEIEGANQ